LLAISWGGSALATWLYTQSFALGSPLTSILLQKTQPIFALLLAGLVLGERRSPGFWFWCAGALAGAWMLTGVTTVPSLHDLYWRQALCALGASALWGGATVAGRALSRTLTPGLLAGSRFALAVPILALLTWLTPGTRFPAAGPHLLTSLGVLLLIVLLPDLAGMGLYYWGLRRTTASVATLAELCYPLTSLLIGLGLLHLHLRAGQWIGLALLLSAVLALGRQPTVVRETKTVPSAPVTVP
jgi:drug/metabolite transporter (DMT)-like permease